MTQNDFRKYLVKKYRISFLRDLCLRYNINFSKENSAKELAALISEQIDYKTYRNNKSSKFQGVLRWLALIPILFVFWQIFNITNEYLKPYGVCEGTKDQIYGPTIRTEMQKDVKVYFNGNEYSHIPSNRFCVENTRGNECILEMRYDKKSIEIFSSFYDFNQKLVGQIVGNKFIVNEDCIYRWKYDEYAVEIIDDKLQVVLQIMYDINLNAIYINGVFWDGYNHVLSNQNHKKGQKLKGHNSCKYITYNTDVNQLKIKSKSDIIPMIFDYTDRNIKGKRKSLDARNKSSNFGLLVIDDNEQLNLDTIEKAYVTNLFKEILSEQLIPEEIIFRRVEMPQEQSKEAFEKNKILLSMNAYCDTPTNYNILYYISKINNFYGLTLINCDSTTYLHADDFLHSTELNTHNLKKTLLSRLEVLVYENEEFKNEPTKPITFKTINFQE